MPLSSELFEETIRQQGPSLLKAMTIWTRGNQGEAEDLLQRACEVAWQKRDKFAPSEPRGDEDPTDSVAGWIYGIAKLEWLQLRRRAATYHGKVKTGMAVGQRWCKGFSDKVCWWLLFCEMLARPTQSYSAHSHWWRDLH